MSHLDPIIKLGIREARRHLGVVAANPTNSAEVVRAYAAGLAEGVKQFLGERMSARKTYELFQSIADDVINDQLPKGK